MEVVLEAPSKIVVYILVILVLTTTMIGTTPPVITPKVIITYIEYKTTDKFTIIYKKYSL